ncbi:Manganese-transporting ATPase 4 [Phytophthora idaei]|nr:Manganese-transporting ATPase 4 [Phytophthora idaei]
MRVARQRQKSEEPTMGKPDAPPQWTGKSIRKLSLHRRRVNPMNLGYGLEHIPFLFLYAYLLYHCFLTAGEPYAQAMRELEEQGLTIPGSVDAPGQDGGLAAAMLSQGSVREAAPAAPTVNYTAMLEQEREGPPLPNPFLPGIVPLLYLLGTVMTHGLMLLFQIWSVRVKAFIKYTPVTSLDEATFVMVVPRSFKGKSSIVEIIRPKHADGTSAGHPYFLFQKHKYVAEEEAGDKGGVLFRKLKAPTTEVVKFYLESRGLSSEHEIEAQLDLYGKNEFSIPQPNFVDMFKQQLLEPLTVFQIFSVCLYMLDEYWQYSLFTLGMILMFEGVTVMSRLKNLQTLRGMGNKAREMFVYREKTWKKMNSDLLVPGDVISVKRETVGDHDNMVPCDCLLLDGSAVLNEATLTGESVPQMKEAIGTKMSPQDLAEQLDMKSGHKVHVLFGGTTVMQTDTSSEASSGTAPTQRIPYAPDEGCTAYVLRTGFSSSQGKLVRMIEFSSGKVTGSSWDAYGLAFLLLIFALLSSGYVLRHGIAQKGKITFELLLRCVLIITSVIPAELPMQTAMAVNSALLNLVKLSIFCTEPFRISLAGKVDICLFDKTGTLTTDQLTAVGVVCEDTTTPTPAAPKDNVLGHVPMIAANLDATLVLAGCQSLVQIDGKMVGDPVEEASIRAIDFSYEAATRHCQAKKDLERANERRWGQGINQKDVFVQIMHRNHFASKLQRMSVIAKVHLGDKGVRVRSLVKGSPEAVAKLMRPETIPAWFWPTYQSLARRGMRVLALAYKDINGRPSEAEVAQQPRSWAESDLHFAGFAVFQCLVRKDSGDILKVLKDSSHQVSMITGDATLTAVHVSKEVGIITRPALILSESSSPSDPLKWTSADDDSVLAPYKSGDLKILVKKYDLCVNGKTLVAAGEVDDVIWKNLNHIRVYARMTPELKEKVLTLLKTHGHHTLMCGDGGNDVGALKQAHIGVALLGGFGSANADKSVTGLAKYQKGNVATISTREDLMKLHVSALKKRLAQQNVNTAHCKVKQDYVELILSEQKKKTIETIKKKQQALAKKNPKLKVLTKEEQMAEMRRKQEELEADVRARQARGESFARMKAIAAFAKREAEEKKKLQMERTGSKGFANFANNAAMAQYMDDFDDGEVPMVKLGDASIASPFTSRAPSIKGCVDIIRQGRCALVTTMQMYQILAVNCLISSYSLSVLYLDKVKWANSQMMALGMISTVASITLSRATPLDKLSPVRPLTSIFQPALFVSLAGQFALHLGCMIYLTNLAKEYTPEGDVAHSKPGEFQPNVMSTVIFLINGVQTVSVCAVNYKGRPFMKPMTENPGLLYSLGISIVGVFLLCTERMPMFNKVLQIVPMPDPRFTRILTGLLTLEVLGAFAWDQLCLLVFAPKIFMASMRALTFKDVRQLLKMTVVSLFIIYILANIDYEEIERQQQLLEEQRAAAEEISS